MKGESSSSGWAMLLLRVGVRLGVRVLSGRRRALAAEEKKSPVVGGGPLRFGVREGVLKTIGFEVVGDVGVVARAAGVGRILEEALVLKA